ncbi:ABC transporter ATP-binding protein [Streptomyces sp. MP131-18]|uniref:ABC transporter ATP-binding protein n=1 Tax=Streptomyces sp. MP131-18 TaxID=1857892 RepID=UPI00097C05D2|nr:ABC transporter ATP-binding protein [Streptomyces sp. MP131-18]ONK11098.1 putative siderophore transport system ATP-binding protein YusV [Streptomyces sp. MP131-18]
MRVEFTHVGIALGGARIVDDVTLTVPPGQFLGLVGPNGSGKSTLLRGLYRVLRPATGTVRIDGQDVWRLPPRRVAQHIAVMTQETDTGFDLNVLDVVLLGRLPHQGSFGGHTRHDLTLAAGALGRVGADHLSRRTFSGLSGGEKQRVLLARALVQESQVLVLDEPTNHLDIAFQLELMRMVRGLGLTTLAALHDLNLAASHCDAIAVLHRGRIIAGGTPAEVLTPDLLREVFGVHAHLLSHPDTGKPLIAFSPGHEPVSTPAGRAAARPRSDTQP